MVKPNLKSAHLFMDNSEKNLSFNVQQVRFRTPNTVHRMVSLIPQTSDNYTFQYGQDYSLFDIIHLRPQEQIYSIGLNLYHTNLNYKDKFISQTIYVL